MPLFLAPATPTADLRGRLADLRRQLRRGAAVAGVAGVIAAVLAAVIISGFVDAAINLPSVVRAFLLIGMIVAAAWLVRRWILRPWMAAGNEVQLALAVEQHFGDLEDAFASAVQFQNERDVGGGSPGLRRAAIRFAVDRTADRDLREMASAKPMALAFAALATIGVFVVLLAILMPTVSSQVLVRLIDPYGDHPWPTRTRLDVVAPEAIARGEPFRIRATIGGEVPDRAELLVALDGAQAVGMSYLLTAENGAADLPIQLEPSRVARSFRFSLSAGDATTGWRVVTVRVPPQFTPFDGRPSPRVRLDFPRYTGLLAQSLPDGTGSAEAVLGTVDHISASVDRPVKSSAVELRLNDPRLIASVVGLPFAAANTTVAIGFAPAAHAIAEPIPLSLDAEKTRCGGSFIPLVSGTYDLTATDAIGLTGRRTLDVRVLADPVPAVSLERPSASTNSLEFVPSASFELRAVIDDPRYAIRRARIEYHTRIGESPRRITLYDGQILEAAMSQTVLAGLGPVALRPQHWSFAQRIRVDQFYHADGKPLTPGDVLSLSVAAEDFDDVTPDKAPGRSHEIELRIVSRERMETKAQAAQGELATALRELHTRQLEAMTQAAQAEHSRRATGNLSPDNIAALAKAETTQQQIGERLGDEREGLRAVTDSFERMLADNPGTNVANRSVASRIARGLERLSQDVLPPVGPLLAAARNEPGPVPPEDRGRGPLPDAVRRQHEAEADLRELASLAEAGRVTGALAAQAAALAADQKQLERDREVAAKTLPPGADPQRLPARDQAVLKSQQERQHELAQKAASLTQELTATAREAPQTPDIPALAAARDHAAPIQNHMNAAAESLGANRLGEAQQRQQTASEQLDRVRAALADTAGPDAERMRTAQTQAVKEIERLTKAQEQLQDRTEVAEATRDPAERRKQLESLAQEQERMARQVRDVARALNRQGQDDAARDLERSAQAMDRAREQLERGQPAHAKQDDALDKLDDATMKTQQAKADTEERLQREQMLKLTSLVKGLADRQSSLGAEAERIFQSAKAGWSRSLLRSLADLARDEELLAKDVEKVSSEHLQSLKVLKFLAEQSAGAMNDVNAAVETARNNGLTAETHDADKTGVVKPQALAVKRLKQLLAAVTPPMEELGEAKVVPQGKAGDSSSGGAARPAPGETVPPFAQLQVLRDLQAELNERTATFAKNRPDPAKWTESDRGEIDAIRRAQAELAELLAEDSVPEKKK